MFEMGTGVAPPPLPPEDLRVYELVGARKVRPYGYTVGSVGDIP